MSLKMPNGAVYGFATVTALAIAASAISNASQAVATIPVDADVDTDDVVLLTSNWPTLTNRATQVEVSGTSATLLGIDTSDVTEFPTGGGAGTILVANEFTDFSQQGDVATSGGEQQYWTGQLLEDRSGRQIQIPTFKNAKAYTLPVYFDPALPWYAAAKAVDRKKDPVILRCRLPDGDTLYYYGYMSFDSDPTMAANTPMQNTMSFVSLSEPTLVEAA